MALPILYLDSGGNAANSGSTDTNSPLASGAAATVAAAVVTLDGAPDLSGVAADGSQTIYLADATNLSSQKKIFKITAVDNGAKTVTVSVAPSGVTSSVWRIGGRNTVLNTLMSALEPGWIGIQNNDYSGAGALSAFRTAGDSSNGFCKWIGKTGVRPKITNTSTGTSISTLVNYSWMENVEIIAQGATGEAFYSNAAHSVLKNVKVSDAGGVGIWLQGEQGVCEDCEVSGTGTVGIYLNGTNGLVQGCNIHDNTLIGIHADSTTAKHTISFNVIESNGGRGIHLSAATGAGGAQMVVLNYNTIALNGNSGLEVADADTAVMMRGNIFYENGNAAGEYNVEWLAGAIELQGIHSYNLFYHSGGGGGANLSGLTANATELTTDPLFTNAAGGDFSLGSTSPAKATGFPGAFLGGPTGYLDMGAVQRQESAAGGGSRGRIFGSG